MEGLLKGELAGFPVDFGEGRGRGRTGLGHVEVALLGRVHLGSK